MAADADARRTARSVLNVAADRHDWSYQWSWLGPARSSRCRPTSSRSQEIIWETRPQLVIETGIARGGSLVLSASILQLLGEGEVLGIDIDIRRPQPGGDRVAPARAPHRADRGLVGRPERGRAQAAPHAREVERVMVVLDSNHTHEHVLAELRAYAPLVTSGQYLVVADTFVEQHPAAGAPATAVGSG